jgi:hypothetical protein
MNPGVIVVAAILLLLAISWSVARRGRSQAPDQGWQPTDEVFKDPRTNRAMRVWVDPQNGSRHNVPEKGMR